MIIEFSGVVWNSEKNSGFMYLTVASIPCFNEARSDATSKGFVRYMLLSRMYALMKLTSARCSCMSQENEFLVSDILPRLAE